MNTKAFFFAVTLLIFFTTSNAQTVQLQKRSIKSKNGAAFFNGAWRDEDNKGFTVMHDGYFNSVALDSTGKWNDVHAGSYTVGNDNTITLKILYSSYPDHVGSLNTAEYTVSGETVKLRHFKKLIDAQGKDITNQMPKDGWETMVRLK